ncbi:MAG: NUDIX hydrolase [Crocinitomicaceae bacterium]
MTEYHRIDVTVDAVIFRKLKNATQVLLIQRKHEPFEGSWAIPGGFVDEGEDLEAAAIRELEEETGLVVDSLEQLHTFGRPDRDPRKRIISVVHWKLLKDPNVEVYAADDASNLSWFSIDDLPELAFDHAEVMAVAVKKLNL